MQKMQELLGRVSMDELSAFVAVVEAHSFTDAAAVVGRDATIVSRRITQLEERLGVCLLSRTTRRVALTEVGALYYRRVRSLLDELDSAGHEASSFAASPQGLLRVSAPVTFGRRWISPLLPAFILRHPKIRVDARFADRHVDVVSEGFDVAIRVGILNDSTLIARRIAPFHNMLYAAPSYIEARGIPAEPAELEAHACLSFTNYVGWPDWALHKDGQRKTIRPSGPLQTDSSEALLLAGIAGLGIILTPDWLAGPAVRAGELVQLLPDWKGSQEGGIYAVMPPGRLIPTKTRIFVDEITQAIQAGWSPSAA
ncbi:LysR family transcription regulator protein [Pandoraea eparura]|uniref:LysR family transcription regulator protein n=1 Tax=Pandoraea eparura TaxID=2508291 RepID=A0A5E4U779_9BURK|nr:LysR family transcriptional regulator [Pandoraea eparura]VVD95342.1 LysR family transcription regulator protein [Pandoraea eparura]